MAKFVAKGTKLQKGDGASPEVFTDIPGVVDFNGPQTTAPEVDASDLDSLAREFLPGLKDNGNFDATLNLDTQNTQHQAILNNVGEVLGTGTYRMLLPNSNGSATFTAWVQNAPVSGGVDAMVQVALSIRITGAVTWAYS